MKRCLVEQGGCGELVEMLFDSGVCQKCDAAIQRGTASVVGPVARRPGRRKLVAGNGRIEEQPPRSDQPAANPCGKYVKGPERGICATCGATRAAHLAAKKSGGGAARKKRGPGRQPAADAGPDDPFIIIEQLRSTYSDERERCRLEMLAWEVKLEVLDEVETAMRGAK